MMWKHYIRTQQANEQTVNQKLELLTVSAAIATWAHGNQLHWKEGCDWPVCNSMQITTVSYQSWFPAGLGLKLLKIKYRLFVKYFTLHVAFSRGLLYENALKSQRSFLTVVD